LRCFAVFRIAQVGHQGSFQFKQFPFSFLGFTDVGAGKAADAKSNGGSQAGADGCACGDIPDGVKTHYQPQHGEGSIIAIGEEVPAGYSMGSGKI
jgi:hypothetical protein